MYSNIQYVPVPANYVHLTDGGSNYQHTRQMVGLRSKPLKPRAAVSSTIETSAQYNLAKGREAAVEGDVPQQQVNSELRLTIVAKVTESVDSVDKGGETERKSFCLCNELRTFGPE